MNSGTRYASARHPETSMKNSGLRVSIHYRPHLGDSFNLTSLLVPTDSRMQRPEMVSLAGMGRRAHRASAGMVSDRNMLMPALARTPSMRTSALITIGGLTNVARRTVSSGLFSRRTSPKRTDTSSKQKDKSGARPLIMPKLMPTGQRHRLSISTVDKVQQVLQESVERSSMLVATRSRSQQTSIRITPGGLKNRVRKTD